MDNILIKIRRDISIFIDSLDCETRAKIMHPFFAEIIIDDNSSYDDSKVGWTAFDKSIHVKKLYYDNYADPSIKNPSSRDPFIYQIITHELVHAKQYATIPGLIWARSIGRFWAEKEAKRIGEMAETWIVQNILNKPLV